MNTVDASNYEYVTARVRSRRSKLFDTEDYRKLMRMSPAEIARFMEESVYQTEIDAIGSRFSGVDLIEYALNRNLAHHFDDLLRWSEGALYEQVANYLRKFDAWNVKTALRGIYSDTGPDAIENDYIRAGELDEDLLERLANADSIEAAVELLDGTLFEDRLEVAYEDYEDTDLLVPLENAVDRAYYENLLSETEVEPGTDSPEALYREFLQAEIDFRNIRNALRLARSGADLDPTEYYVDGGQLFDPADLRRLAGDRDALAEAVRESAYGDDLDAALDELESAESLIGFEHSLDAALLEYSDHLSHVYPLSVCPVLAFVLAKEREVENIRAIARGREVGLDEDEIEEELVML
ncbi:MAG: V-type ATP synthase subunit C [Halobacteriaceae archaeon]